MIQKFNNSPARKKPVCEKPNIFSALILSFTELMDCDGLDQACKGGLPANAYESIEKLGTCDMSGGRVTGATIKSF